MKKQDKLYTSINEFKKSLNKYSVLFFGYPEGALVKDNKNNFYFYTYDQYNDDRYTDYLNREEIDTDEDGVNFEFVSMGENLNKEEVLEDYLNGTLPTVEEIKEEINDVDKLYKINNQRTYYMLFEFIDEKYHNFLKKYRNEII